MPRVHETFEENLGVSGTKTDENQRGENGRRGIRTPDQLVRSQLLYPAELAVPRNRAVGTIALVIHSSKRF